MKQLRAAPVLACVCLCLLAGCVTQAEVSEAIASWEGSHINEVVNSWGPPTSTFAAPGGGTWYTWKESTWYVNEYGGGQLQAWRSLLANETGIVVKWRWQGQSAITRRWPRTLRKPGPTGRTEGQAGTGPEFISTGEEGRVFTGDQR